MRFIDPPSPFAPRHAWEAFLAEISKVAPRSAEVDACIAMAREALSGASGEDDTRTKSSKKLADYLAKTAGPSV